jgi:hypothetical protein
MRKSPRAGADPGLAAVRQGCRRGSAASPVSQELPLNTRYMPLASASICTGGRTEVPVRTWAAHRGSIR